MVFDPVISDDDFAKKLGEIQRQYPGINEKETAEKMKLSRTTYRRKKKKLLKRRAQSPSNPNAPNTEVALRDFDFSPARIERESPTLPEDRWRRPVPQFQLSDEAALLVVPVYEIGVKDGIDWKSPSDTIVTVFHNLSDITQILEENRQWSLSFEAHLREATTALVQQRLGAELAPYRAKIDTLERKLERENCRNSELAEANIETEREVRELREQRALLSEERKQLLQNRSRLASELRADGPVFGALFDQLDEEKARVRSSASENMELHRDVAHMLAMLLQADGKQPNWFELVDLHFNPSCVHVDWRAAEDIVMRAMGYSFGRFGTRSDRVERSGILSAPVFPDMPVYLPPLADRPEKRYGGGIGEKASLSVSPAPAQAGRSAMPGEFPSEPQLTLCMTIAQDEPSVVP